MEPTPWMDGPPPRMLLATDLSARCDRALDRSVQLAAQWGAQLVAMTVLEQAQMPDQVLDWLAQESDAGGERLARRILQRELARHDVPATIELAKGDVTTAIRERARTLDCPLVVTGMARDEPFGRLLAGSTTDALARSGAPMLLVVRDRPHDAYGSVLVMTDFSEASRHALHAAVKLFPAARIVLYHAYAPAFSGMVDEGAGQRAAVGIEQREAPAFLARSQLAPQERQRVRIVVEAGPPEIMAARYVRRHDIQLVAIGNRGRSGVADMLLGSSATRLMQWLPCDTLVVRAPAG